MVRIPKDVKRNKEKEEEKKAGEGAFITPSNEQLYFKLKKVREKHV